MGENSKIQWTDHTFNGWVGCTKVSPACDHCYAEALAKRYGWAEWGANLPRRLTKDWTKPLAWDRKAAKLGVRHRVFSNSLSDVFDAEVDDQWRVNLMGLIEKTRNLDWLLLTKRPKVALDFFKAYRSIPSNIWMGTTVENQPMADLRIPPLLEINATKRFLSCEPLLGPVDLTAIGGEWSSLDSGWDENVRGAPILDWVIVGGESGNDARPMHPDWARSIRDQCQAAGVPFFFKQWGEWKNGSDFASDARAVLTDGRVLDATREALSVADRDNSIAGRNPTMMRRVGKKAAGRTLDGREWNEIPVAA